MGIPQRIKIYSIFDLKCCIFCAVESRIYRTKIQHLLYKYSISEKYSTNIQHLKLAEALNSVH